MCINTTIGFMFFQKAVQLSASVSIGFRLSCYLLGLMFISCIFIAVQIISIVTILLTWILMQLLWIALEYGNWAMDQFDAYREEYQKIYPPPTDVYSHLVYVFYGVLIAIGGYGVIMVLESVFSRLRAKLQRSIPDFKVCHLCVGKPRTQYFQPCRHLVCCSSCGHKLYKCPVCKEKIKTETHVQPLTGMFNFSAIWFDVNKE